MEQNSYNRIVSSTDKVNDRDEVKDTLIGSSGGVARLAFDPEGYQQVVAKLCNYISLNASQQSEDRIACWEAKEHLIESEGRAPTINEIFERTARHAERRIRESGIPDYQKDQLTDTILDIEWKVFQRHCSNYTPTQTAHAEFKRGLQELMRRSFRSYRVI